MLVGVPYASGGYPMLVMVPYASGGALIAAGVGRGSMRRSCAGNSAKKHAMHQINFRKVNAEIDDLIVGIFRIPTIF